MPVELIEKLNKSPKDCELGNKFAEPPFEFESPFEDIMDKYRLNAIAQVTISALEEGFSMDEIFVIYSYKFDVQPTILDKFVERCSDIKSKISSGNGMKFWLILGVIILIVIFLLNAN